jgi:hypothetical protein
MAKVEFHPWKSTPYLVIVLLGQHYNHPEHIAKYAPGGSVGKVPHPYKPLGLLAGPLPHRQHPFCLSTKSWGQVDILP